jgi:hypothetical protein
MVVMSILGSGMVVTMLLVGLNRLRNSEHGPDRFVLLHLPLQAQCQFRRQLFPHQQLAKGLRQGGGHDHVLKLVN